MDATRQFEFDRLVRALLLAQSRKDRVSCASLVRRIKAVAGLVA